MSKYRDALSSVADRLSRAFALPLFPGEISRVIDVAPLPARRDSQRARRPPPMSRVMPRMGYRYHLNWTPPEGAVKRWWRKATKHHDTESG